MGATKKMIENNPDIMGICHRPELHWMEQEYFNYLKEKEYESICKIKVDFEIVPGKKS